VFIKAWVIFRLNTRKNMQTQCKLFYQNSRKAIYTAFKCFYMYLAWRWPTCVEKKML